MGAYLKRSISSEKEYIYETENEREEYTENAQKVAASEE